MKIQVLDPIYSRADKNLINDIRPILKYDYTFYVKKWVVGKNGKKYPRKVPKKTTGYHITKKEGIFLTGFIPKIKERLDVDVVDNTVYPVSYHEPFIEGIEFREDQKELIDLIVEHKRGVIKSPTRSGKTVVAMGMVSRFPDYRILFLCHTLDILTQTYDEFIDKGFTDVSFKRTTGRIVLMTIQTFSKLNATGDHFDAFDIVIVDECHHANSRKSLYGKTLQMLEAPMRIGFTATLPEEHRKKLALEGLLGPVIGEVTVDDGVELGFLAKPKVTLVPLKKFTTDLTRYADIYDKFIVDNRARNRSIATLTRSRVNSGKSVLIIVKAILHGENIQNILDRIGVISHFVQGRVEKDVRNQIKKDLQSKKYKCVIATAVWREGVNIPSLDCVINACGGKSEIMTLQAVGRSLTASKGKDEGEIIDYLDPYKYLAEHSIKRISLYIDQGWL